MRGKICPDALAWSALPRPNAESVETMLTAGRNPAYMQTAAIFWTGHHDQAA